MLRFKTKLKHTSGLLDLTPLVDVVFLMLIFFIVTSDILPLKSLHIENPTINRDASPLTTQLLVVMDAQNVIYVGSKKSIADLVTLKDHLTDELSVLKKQHPTIHPTVVVSVDRRVEYGDFLKLFSTIQEMGIKMRLVYKPEKEIETEYL
jgi:biopolymer transport protein ExbD